MLWLLVALAAVMFSGVVVLAFRVRSAADRQRQMWADEEVRVLQRRAQWAMLNPANDDYPEVWPIKDSR